MKTSSVLLLRGLLLLALMGAWETLPRAGLVNPMLLPPLSDVLSTLGTLLQRANVQEALGVTAAEVVVAFLIAVPAGTAPNPDHQASRYRGSP